MKRLLFALVLFLFACSKSPGPTNVPAPPDTARSKPSDTVRIGYPDTTKKPGKDTTIIPSVTKIYDCDGWTITLDRATHVMHEMEGSGDTVNVIMDPADTGAIHMELINADKGSLTITHDQYQGDTNYHFKFSNINHFYAINQPRDTVAKLALHFREGSFTAV